MFGQAFHPREFVASLVVLVLSIALHEFGHAFSADRLGDQGPRRAGRVTLWPDKHFEPTGFFMMVVSLLAGFGIGWGKPVVVNPGVFRNPKRDMLIVTICGPLMNMLLAVVFGLILRAIFSSGHIAFFVHANGSLKMTATMLFDFVVYNLYLFFFNLIPIAPLDGSKVLATILPPDMSYSYARFMSAYGIYALVALVLLGGPVLGPVMGKAVDHVMRILLGPSF